MQGIYLRTANEHAAAYNRLDEEFTRLRQQAWDGDQTPETQLRLSASYLEREQSALIAVTFAGMTIEAFLYDFAAAKLGDSYVQKRLDRKPLKEKYFTYPERVCGKRPVATDAAYIALEKLVDLRNDLVHYKSRAFGLADLFNLANHHDELAERLREGVQNAVSCVLAVVAEFDRLQGGAERHLAQLKAAAEIK